MLGVVNQMVTKEIIYIALINQSISKAPGYNKINFNILHIVQYWENKRIITMIS